MKELSKGKEINSSCIIFSGLWQKSRYQLKRRSVVSQSVTNDDAWWGEKNVLNRNCGRALSPFDCNSSSSSRNKQLLIAITKKKKSIISAMCARNKNKRAASNDGKAVSAFYRRKCNTGSAYTKDLLAITTDYTKTTFNLIDKTIVKIKTSKAAVVLLGTTQPAHLFAAVATIALCFLLAPYQNGNGGGRTLPEQQQHFPKPSLIVTFVYLLSVSLHFGAQIWMTFVSGLSLYFALPRHVFGGVQRVLFPKYFLMNAALSFVTLVTFLQHSKLETWQTHAWAQVVVLTTCFVIEFLIRLYLSPPLIALIDQKNKIEVAAGLGKEVGEYDPGVLTRCPHYTALHKKFRKVHMTIAVGNMIAMGLTVAHLYYLAEKICIV